MRAWTYSFYIGPAPREPAPARRDFSNYCRRYAVSVSELGYSRYSDFVFPDICGTGRTGGRGEGSVPSCGSRYPQLDPGCNPLPNTVDTWPACRGASMPCQETASKRQSGLGRVACRATARPLRTRRRGCAARQLGLALAARPQSIMNWMSRRGAPASCARRPRKEC